MTPSSERDCDTACQIRLDGHLDQHWASWFGSLSFTREADGTTTLAGAVADQAELHGLLTKIRDLGITLISVAVVRNSGGAAAC
jgi:hypothetical protein